MSLVAFDHLPIVESREPLVDVKAFPFLAVPVYHHNGWAPTPQLYAREGLLDKLAAVQHRHLARHGWRWVVYDAWRPREVQAAIFQHYWRKMSLENQHSTHEELELKVRTFVTVPASHRIPPHSTGGAIDLGWWDCHRGRLVAMGSDFDEFTATAANGYFEQPGQDLLIRAHRRNLTDWLAEEDITSDADEWFHKDWGNQKWAAQTGASAAAYGEILACEPRGSRLSVRWGIEESHADRTQRIQALHLGLDLSHPALRHAPRIPQLSEIVGL